MKDYTTPEAMCSEEFECYLINILDSEELTDKEKVELIRKHI